MTTRKVDAEPGPGGAGAGGWPAWATRLATAALVFHLAAVLAGALAAPPSSAVQRGLADLFAPYYGLLDQGYSYRYYAPAPPPTPLVRATLGFGDGRPDEVVDIPRRGLLPRLRYQRELALANHLVAEALEAERQGGEIGRSRWARSYARHLGKEFPGCSTVVLTFRYHLIPDAARVRALLDRPGSRGRVDLDAEEFFTPPKRIGEFPCDAS